MAEVDRMLILFLSAIVKSLFCFVLFLFLISFLFSSCPLSDSRMFPPIVSIPFFLVEEEFVDVFSFSDAFNYFVISFDRSKAYRGK